jgi:uncharacterized protein (TIGR03086 family)
MIDLRPACERMTELLARLAADQLAGPTPCAEYAVRDLLDHVDSVSAGFAALARKDAAEQTDGELRSIVADPGDHWRDTVTKHVRSLGEAWDDPAAWQGTTDTGGLELPNELWGKIALTEMVVHGWDLAQATGQPFELPETTLRACYDHVAAFVPDAPVASLWGPAAEVPVEAPLIDRIVGVTGRSGMRPGRGIRPGQSGRASITFRSSAS